MSYQEHIKMLDEHITKQKEQHEAKIGYHAKVNKHLLDKNAEIEADLDMLRVKCERLYLDIQEHIRTIDILTKQVNKPFNNLFRHFFRRKQKWIT